MATRNSFVVGSAATFVSIGVLRARAKAAQFEFKCGGDLPIEHPITIRGVQMWAAISRESGGRVNARLFPNNVLGGDTAMLSQLRSGALQFQMIPPSVIQNVVPAAAISELGFVFANEEAALRAMDGALGGYVRREIGAKNLFALSRIWNSGMRQMISSSHPIQTVNDLAGFKIRTPASRLTIELFRTLGASPTPINASELYTALQTKIVEGADLPLVGIQASRYFEVVRYLSITNHSWSSIWIVANGDLWNSLPADLQEIIERNNTKYAMLARRDTALLNASIADKLKRQGLASNIADTASFRARLSPYYVTASKEFSADGWSLLEAAAGKKLG